MLFHDIGRTSQILSGALDHVQERADTQCIYIPNVYYEVLPTGYGERRRAKSDDKSELNESHLFGLAGE